MERQIINDLSAWKSSPNRKPLILKGARQVGKTYILREFGRRYYKNVAYINCDHNTLVSDLFKQDYNIHRILLGIEAITNVHVEPGETLIILDEIQELEYGLASLKYFCEDAPEYHVAVAGSLLGIALHKSSSFPVGKVDFLQLYPMNYEEFLMAAGEQRLLDLLNTGSWADISPLRTRYIELLRQYYYVGGMPAAVLEYITGRNLAEVRRIQGAVVESYKNDISKHAPNNEVKRINMVLDSIPSQLAKENKKFIYGAVKKGGRAVDFELAIQWLIDCGIIYKVPRISSPAIPLSFYEDLGAFKLFLLDLGLMGCIAKVPAAQFLVADNAIKEFKGAFTEQYVLQQMKSLGDIHTCYYSNDTSTLEIDFVVQIENSVVPIEVKAEENLRSKSLRNYCAANSGLHGIRFSMSDYKEQGWMTNIPLYAIPFIKSDVLRTKTKF